MRVKQLITAIRVPFNIFVWNGARFSVDELDKYGWEITLSTQTAWRVLSGNDYFYFRHPKSRMIARVTWLRNSPDCHIIEADFMTLEKNMPSLWRKERSEEQQIRNEELVENRGSVYSKLKDWAKINDQIVNKAQKLMSIDFARDYVMPINNMIYTKNIEFAEEPVVDFDWMYQPLEKKSHNDKTELERWNGHLESMEYLTEEGREYLLANLMEKISVTQLLDTVLKRLPKPKKKAKSKPTAKIINFEDYLQKALKEIA